VLESSREVIAGDVVRYAWVLRVGDTPNAQIRVHRVVRERSPGHTRPTREAILLQHGDFASFASNFAPSLVSPEVAPEGTLAVYLAERGIDVWGVDRRWATVPAGPADVSDYGDMGFAVAVADVERALVFARTLRGLGGDGAGRFFVGGFSSGGALTYSVASEETTRPAPLRQVKGIVVLDMATHFAPADDELRVRGCNRHAADAELLAGGMVDEDNTFISEGGRLAREQPDAETPWIDGLTNREELLGFVARTFDFYQPAPFYHLNGGRFDGDVPTDTRYAPYLLVADWFAAAPQHESMKEAVDLDAVQCGEAPLPLVDHIADVRVPVYYVGAGGGYGVHGVFGAHAVASGDVTTTVWSAAAEGRDDVGHADLLYATDAPDKVWKPLAKWILQH
jgi:hypothetical protein